LSPERAASQPSNISFKRTAAPPLNSSVRPHNMTFLRVLVLIIAPLIVSACAKPTKEFPRLCRGGSRSLTYAGVHRGNSNSCAAKHMRGESTDGRVRKLKPRATGVPVSRGVHTEVSSSHGVRRTSKLSARGVPPVGGAEGEPSPGRSFDA